jgi:hypothetical protein
MDQKLLPYLPNVPAVFVEQDDLAALEIIGWLRSIDSENSERRLFSQHYHRQWLATALSERSKKSNVTGPPNPLFNQNPDL